MNYASDPEWAYKEGYDPARRQAYENQVMRDRAAQQHRHAEYDAAAMIGSAVALGSWFQGRAERKRQKAIQDALLAYQRYSTPPNAYKRRIEYSRALEQARAEWDEASRMLDNDILWDRARMKYADEARRADLAAHLDLLVTMREEKRSAYDATVESLRLKNLDIIEFDAECARIAGHEVIIGY